MTDRELLELAAKAAGFQNWTWMKNSIFVEEGTYRGSGIGYYWNPLTDDGDALRLAVKLKMAINITPSKIFAGDGSTGHTETMDTSDPYAATRRAIVRAAAEIGRNIK